jgi:DNA-binding PadR family transcriptional regulator
MGNEKTISERTQRLADTYFRINDQGRELLDIVVQKLQKTHGDQEDIKRITDFAFVKPLKVINEKY